MVPEHLRFQNRLQSCICSMIVLILAFTVTSSSSAQEVYEKKRLGIRFELVDGLAPIAELPPGVLKSWRKMVGRASIRVELRYYPEMHSLEDYILFVLDGYRERDPNFKFSEETGVEVGGVPGLEVAIYDESVEGFTLIRLFYWKDAGIEIAATVRAENADKLRKEMENILQGFSLVGKPPDPKWSKDEVKQAIARIFGPGNSKIRPVRTKHYIVFAQGGAGRKVASLFEKKLFPNVKKILPIKETGKERLLPVYVFADYRDFMKFYTKSENLTADQARLTISHAFRDSYVMSDDHLSSADHFHESLHQIVYARHKLRGGGIWFHEGLAELAREQVHPRNLMSLAGAAAGRGDATRLRELFALREFVRREEIVNVALVKGQARINQSASVFQFLREKKSIKKKFLEFVQRAGSVRPGNLEALEEISKDLYGWTLAELESEWKQYLKKRS